MKIRSTTAVLSLLSILLVSRAEAATPITKRLAWELGSTLSLAALVNAQGSSGDLVARNFARAKKMGAAAGIATPALPAKTGNAANDGAATIHYLLKDAGGAIGAKLADKYGADHAAAFELAIKSNLLILLYAPGDKTGVTLAQVIERSGTKAGLPPGLWRPVVVAVNARASSKAVKEGVFKMHEAISEYVAK